MSNLFYVLLAICKLFVIWFPTIVIIGYILYSLYKLENKESEEIVAEYTQYRKIA